MSEEVDFQGAVVSFSVMEREFRIEVEHAKKNSPSNGNSYMPDAMETIFEEALVLGRKGAMGDHMGIGHLKTYRNSR